MGKGISEIVQGLAASIREAAANIKDPSGADRFNAKNKAESLADLKFIQGLRSNTSMHTKSVTEVLAIIKKGMTSYVLKNWHLFYVEHLRKAEEMGPVGLLLKLEEHITNFMTSLSPLWHHQRSPESGK